MLAVIGAVGQAEREAMLERQREGIAKAKADGRYRGRVPTARRKADEIIRLKEEGVRPSEIASRLGIGRASVYRVLGAQTAAIRWPITASVLNTGNMEGTVMHHRSLPLRWSYLAIPLFILGACVPPSSTRTSPTSTTALLNTVRT